MRLKYLIYNLVFVLGISTIVSCNKSTCPTYATSGPSKLKKTKRPKKNAPWHKSKSMKKGKRGGRNAPR
tara:strand:- start:279 stop:485 length:207 start_codon:yes stop_codon:yes gene_type:complete